jgi:hypothetical protein
MVRGDSMDCMQAKVLNAPEEALEKQFVTPVWLENICKHCSKRV